MDDLKWELLTETNGRMQADLLKSYLEAAGDRGGVLPGSHRAYLWDHDRRAGPGATVRPQGKGGTGAGAAGGLQRAVNTLI